MSAATTLDLFDAPPVGEIKPLRIYQAKCCQAIDEKLAAHRSTLVLLATGGGKTRIAGEVIRKWRGKRCLFLAHRDELITQAVDRIGELIDAPPEIEQGGFRASRFGSRPVVASVQSLSQPRRLQRFNSDDFDLIITDEVHHGPSTTYRRIYDHFPSAKMIGLTATGDRADGQALGRIMESVAFRYELPEMIADGWLSPIQILQVHIDTLDFSTLHTRAGDFRKEELDALLAQEKNLHGIAAATAERAESRKTIVFTSNVANAHALSEILNRYSTTGRAAVVDGEMDKIDRRRVLEGFRDGKIQYVVNCNVLTEGFDEPSISCVVMARPTKSRALYSQQLGRGTRLFPGKENCLVLDFTGNSGKHDVVGAVDILGGKYTAAEIVDAKKILAKADGPMSLEEAISEGKKAAERKAMRRKLLDERARERRASVTADRVEHSAHDASPIAEAPKVEAAEPPIAGLSPKVLQQFTRLMSPKHAERWFRDNPNAKPGQVGAIVGKLLERERAGLATNAQRHALRKRGLDATQWKKRQASKVLDWMNANQWRHPGGVLAQLLQESA